MVIVSVAIGKRMKTINVVLGVVIVDYKSANSTINFVNTELSKITTPKRIVIVNNSCTEVSNALLANGCCGNIVNGQAEIDLNCSVFIIGTEDNLGYAKGNNVGARFLYRYFGVDYILFTNNDLRLIQKDVVEKLIGIAVQYDDAGGVGPRVIDPQGNDQSPMKYCNIWKRIIAPYSLYPFLYPFLRVGFLSDTIQNAAFGIYYRLMGCFFIVKTSVFMAVDGFDEGTFLYAEEMIISERMIKLGKKMYYNPNVVIAHEHGQVILKNMSEIQAKRIRVRSELYYFKKYLGINKLEYFCSCCAFYLYSKFYYPILKAIKYLLSWKK